MTARDCLLQAYDSKVPATFTSTILTVEGDPVVWNVTILADNRIAITVDTTKDKFGEQKVTTYRCKTMGQRTVDLAGKEQKLLSFRACTGGPNKELDL